MADPLSIVGLSSAGADRLFKVRRCRFKILRGTAKDPGQQARQINQTVKTNPSFAQ